jgi:hypothetical protein
MEIDAVSMRYEAPELGDDPIGAVQHATLWTNHPKSSESAAVLSPS